jgi:hypothetical protein
MKKKKHTINYKNKTSIMYLIRSATQLDTNNVPQSVMSTKSDAAENPPFGDKIHAAELCFLLLSALKQKQRLDGTFPANALPETEIVS